MCLLVVVFRPGTPDPLVVGANRDERLDRPAVPVSVLRRGRPRILGGRDLRANGTWLAVNEHGVVAGLTNTPSPAGRDPAKRSRGELPIAAARHSTAAGAVSALLRRVRPACYNPAWMLVGDREALFAVTIAGRRPAVVQLGPGLHVLENHPPGEESPKVVHVAGLLGAAAATANGSRADGRRADGSRADGSPGDDLVRRLGAVLADHSRPALGPSAGAGGGGAAERAAEHLSACVHTDGYGTRSSALVRVPADPSLRPWLAVADGPPCRAHFEVCDDLWGDGAAGGGGAVKGGARSHAPALAGATGAREP